MLTLSLHMTKKEGKKGWQTNININIYLAHKQIPFDGFQCRFFIVLPPDNWIWKRLGMSRRNWRIYSHRFSARDERRSRKGRRGRQSDVSPVGLRHSSAYWRMQNDSGNLGVSMPGTSERGRETANREKGSDLLWIVNIKNITKEQTDSTGPVKWNITTHQILACTNKHVPVCVCTFSFHSFLVANVLWLMSILFANISLMPSLLLFPLCCNFSLLFSIYFSAWTH